MGNLLELLFCQEPLNFLGSVYRNVVPIEHPLPGCQVGPFYVQSFQKVLQISNDLASMNSGAPLNVVRVDNTLVIEEARNYLFRAARSDLGHYGAWFSLFQLLF